MTKPRIKILGRINALNWVLYSFIPERAFPDKVTRNEIYIINVIMVNSIKGISG